MLLQFAVEAHNPSFADRCKTLLRGERRPAMRQILAGKVLAAECPRCAGS